MHAVLREVLRAALEHAGRLALPVVEQDVVLLVRPPDRRVFQFTIVRQQVLAVFDRGVRAGVARRGEAYAAVHVAHLQPRKDVDAAVVADERRGVARLDHRRVEPFPRPRHRVGDGVAGLVGGVDVIEDELFPRPHDLHVVDARLVPVVRPLLEHDLLELVRPEQVFRGRADALGVLRPPAEAVLRRPARSEHVVGAPDLDHRRAPEDVIRHGKAAVLHRRQQTALEAALFRRRGGGKRGRGRRGRLGGKCEGGEAETGDGCEVREFHRCHSYRSASIGSRRDAFHAG